MNPFISTSANSSCFSFILMDVSIHIPYIILHTFYTAISSSSSVPTQAPSSPWRSSWCCDAPLCVLTCCPVCGRAGGGASVATRVLVDVGSEWGERGVGDTCWTPPLGRCRLGGTVCIGEISLGSCVEEGKLKVSPTGTFFWSSSILDSWLAMEARRAASSTCTCASSARRRGTCSSCCCARLLLPLLCARSSHSARSE